MASRTREHEIAVEMAHLGSLLEQLEGEAGQRQRSSVVVLGPINDGDSTHEVEVRPLESQELATLRTSRECQDDKRVEKGIVALLAGLEQPLALLV